MHSCWACHPPSLSLFSALVTARRRQFVVVEPTATLEEVADALHAYTDRRYGDMGVVIVAEDRGGKKLLRHVVSRVDVLAFETDSLAAAKQ